MGGKEGWGEVGMGGRRRRVRRIEGGMGGGRRRVRRIEQWVGRRV